MSSKDLAKYLDDALFGSIFSFLECRFLSIDFQLITFSIQLISFSIYMQCTLSFSTGYNIQ